MTDLSGLTAVVTGGNSGIGRALAVGIAKAGGNVAVWARNAERSADAVAEIAAHGVKAIAVSCDVTDEAAVAAAMARTVDELGPLGCFVANAGIAEAAPLTEMTLQTWRRVLRTNLTGAVLRCALVGPRSRLAPSRVGESCMGSLPRQEWCPSIRH